MLYYLHHKNTIVLEADYEPNASYFYAVKKIINPTHLPIGIEITNIISQLNFWWKSRLIPKNRSSYFIKSPEFSTMVSNSYGFNLSDQYWIKPVDSELTWEKGNFFTNTFNEEIGAYITGLKSSKIRKISSDCPDLFSNGEQDKRWVILRNRRTLLKYGRPPYTEQPFNEVLASEICRRLKFSHVTYKINVSKDQYYSSCACFIDHNTEFIPAAFIYDVKPKAKNISSYQHFISCCEKHGVSNMKEITDGLSQMMLIDYIIGNTDRHFGNFGLIRNAETLEWIGFAPIFDNGNSMYYQEPTSDLRKSVSLVKNVKCKTFASDLDLQLRKYSDQISSLDIDFSVLDGIDDFYSNLLSINNKCDNERKVLLCSLLIQRIQNAKTIINHLDIAVIEFLQTIQNNTDNIDYLKKISLARAQLLSNHPEYSKQIDSFITGLKAKDEKDLVTKIKKACSLSHKP